MPWALAERRSDFRTSPLFGIQVLKETGTVSGGGHWLVGLLGIPGRDKRQAPDLKIARKWCPEGHALGWGV